MTSNCLSIKSMHLLIAQATASRSATGADNIHPLAMKQLKEIFSVFEIVEGRPQNVNCLCLSNSLIFFCLVRAQLRKLRLLLNRSISTITKHIDFYYTPHTGLYFSFIKFYFYGIWISFGWTALTKLFYFSFKNVINS